MRAEKQYLISEVETHLKKSDYVILANFSKVTVSDVAELRNSLAAENAEFHVVKNSSLRVAAKALGLPEFDTAALAGPTAQPGPGGGVRPRYPEAAGRAQIRRGEDGPLTLAAGSRSASGR